MYKRVYANANPHSLEFEGSTKAAYRHARALWHVLIQAMQKPKNQLKTQFMKLTMKLQHSNSKKVITQMQQTIWAPQEP